MLGRAALVSEDDAFLDDMGVHSRVDGFGLQTMLIGSWRELRVHARELSSRSGRISDVQGHRAVQAENGSRPIAGDPEVTEDQGGRDGHEGELDARVLAAMYASADRRSIAGGRGRELPRWPLRGPFWYAS